MNWLEFALSILTLILGGGWFVTYKAHKREKEGEAVQAEAGGWEAQQRVYQRTIEDQQTYYDRLKEDFQVVLDENSNLRKENNEYRVKINELEKVVFELKRETSRLGRRIEALSEKKKAAKK